MGQPGVVQYLQLGLFQEPELHAGARNQGLFRHIQPTMIPELTSNRDLEKNNIFDPDQLHPLQKYLAY